MRVESVKEAISSSLSKTCTTALLKHLGTVQDCYLVGDYDKCITASGKFVEAVLKGLHFFTEGVKLKSIKVGDEINRLANLPKTTYPESIRLLVPRACRTIYHIASDRGARHDITDFEPAQMDATFVSVSCAYVVSELVRLFSPGNISPEQAQALAEELLEKKIPLIFSTGDTKRVLDTSLSYAEQTLCLLYDCPRSTAKEAQLLMWTEHSNSTVYRGKVLKPLHKNRLIEYQSPNAMLTPKGVRVAEDILRRH